MRYTEHEAREKIVEAGLELLEAGLTIRTWGNISARLDDDTILITPSGRGYDLLKPEDITLLHLNDMSWEGTYKPSSEKKVHASVYRHRTDVDFIIHTHQYMASAISIAGRDYILSSEDSVRELGRTVPCARYGMSSTKMLEKAVEECVVEYPQSNSMLMRSHGALIFGENKEQTMERAKILEKECTQAFYKKDPIKTFQERYPSKETPYDIGSSIRTNDGILYHQRSGEVRLHSADEAKTSAQRAHWNLYHMKSSVGCVRYINHPAVMAYSMAGKEMPAVLDDVAQITGYKVPCAGSAEDTDIARLLTKHSMVLVKSNGGLVCGPDEEEAEARAQILIKGAYTALFRDIIGTEFRVKVLDATVQKTFYEKKYAKLKG